MGIYEIHQAAGSPLAEEALCRISEFYRIEAEVRGRPPDERKAARQQRSKPFVEALHAWLSAEALHAWLSAERSVGASVHAKRNRVEPWPGSPMCSSAWSRAGPRPTSSSGCCLGRGRSSAQRLPLMPECCDGETTLAVQRNVLSLSRASTHARAEPVEPRRIVGQDQPSARLVRRPVEETVEQHRLVRPGSWPGWGQLLAQSIRSGAWRTSALASAPTSSNRGGPILDVS